MSDPASISRASLRRDRPEPAAISAVGSDRGDLPFAGSPGYAFEGANGLLVEVARALGRQAAREAFAAATRSKAKPTIAEPVA